MSCAHPLHIRPSYLIGSHYISAPKDYDVPCGYCVNCRKDYQNYVIDRANYEYITRLCASFVTFTYDDVHLIDRCVVRDQFGFLYDDGKPRATLRFSDLENYIMNIRKYIKNHSEIQNKLCQPDFSYLYCGEYGDCFGRPHFHVLFFGLDFAYCKKILFNQWKYGFIDVLPLLDGGIRYVCKYMDKFEKGHLAWLKYDVKGLARPKLRMSRGFGQGLLWSNTEDIVDNFYTYPVAHGKRRPISAYWKQLLTGNCVSRDVTKSSFFEKHPVYLALQQRQIEYSMKTYNLHRTQNIKMLSNQKDFKLKLARIREANIISRLRMSHTPVPDFDSVIIPKFGFTSYDGKKIRKLPSVSQRLLADMYRYSLEQEYLLARFPE